LAQDCKVRTQVQKAKQNFNTSRVNEVGGLRHAGEMKAYIDLLFLALIVLLCVSKIVTD
jgi:hypothetical protein